jgi:hypothetical protein
LAGLADGADRAEEFAEPEGRAVPRPSADALAAAEDPVLEVPVVEFRALGCWALGLCALGLWVLDRCEADRGPEAAVAGEWWLGFAGPVAGLNVATDSMAPATRQTARMLASSGITVPGPENGEVSRRSRRRRRRARSSRW